MSSYWRYKQVDMNRKFKNHRQQTIPRHLENETQRTDRNTTAVNTQLSLPQRNNCKTKRHLLLNYKARTKYKTPYIVEATRIENDLIKEGLSTMQVVVLNECTKKIPRS